LRLAPHPRLYLGADSLGRLGQLPTLPWLREAARCVRRDAAHWANVPPLTYRRDVHNEHLGRAREVQTRVVTLLVRWQQTGRERYRQAALAHVMQMGEWEYWSWIAWRQRNPRPDAIFDLSYGENSATLAIAYDWLHATLTPDERRRLLEIARRWSFCAGLRHARPGGIWWFGRPDSNWNAVCAGGLGMLALAMYEEVAAARALLPRVEQSISAFVKYLDGTNGGWPEGIGYWNYGMRYAFMYLLSHEAATGRAHPLLRRSGVRQTLSFPLDFCPHGQPCSFGDVNSWTPLPFHYSAAARLGERAVCAALDAHLARGGIARGTGRRSASWPSAAEWLALHPGTSVQPARQHIASPAVKIYAGLDWGIVADRMPEPQLYAAVRGGTTRVPHGHRDLLSFHCVVGGERLVTNLVPQEYLDTTFSPRREEIFEVGPFSKSTLLINGVGVVSGATLDCTEPIRLPGAVGIRLEATTAMGAMRDGPAAEFCGRVVLLLKRRAFLVLDHVRLPHVGRVEARLHTFAHVRAGGTYATIRGQRERLHVACAANVPAQLWTAGTAPTTPTAPSSTMLRFCTLMQHREVIMAMLLTPQAKPGSVHVAAVRGGLVALVKGLNWHARVALTDRLRPLKPV